jgi:peptidoglycan/LPS O-acetylase OafA/YrhL
MVQSGSDNAYGIYLAQMIFITLLGWIGWRNLDSVLPWPLVAVVTVAVVFVACIALTAVLARTPWSKALTGRSRASWRSLLPSREESAASVGATPASGPPTTVSKGDSPLEPA